MKYHSNLTPIIPKALILSLILIFLLAACGPGDSTTPTPLQDGTFAYPAPGETGYPTIVTQSFNPAYPPEPGEINEAERFMIERPLAPGSTTVTGTAPRNLSIAIVDITFGGVVLGTGITDDDGRFSVPVSALPEGHRIGLTITDVTDGRTFEEVAVELYDYRGEGFMNVPSVGVFFDTVMTQP